MVIIIIMTIQIVLNCFNTNSYILLWSIMLEGGSFSSSHKRIDFSVTAEKALGVR